MSTMSKTEVVMATVVAQAMVVAEMHAAREMYALAGDNARNLEDAERRNADIIRKVVTLERIRRAHARHIPSLKHLEGWQRG